MAQDHYFSSDPAAPSQPRTVSLELDGRTVELRTDRGVFAHGQIDRGTHLLLRTLPDPPAAGLLDLGCGYGPVAIALAIRAPAATVWAVDVNRRARELCERNAESAGLSNVVVAAPDDVPEAVRFAMICSNPPVRIGKPALHELFSRWLERLDPGGRMYLVVQRHLGSDSLARWFEEIGFTVARLRSRGGYRVLEVHRAATTRHDVQP